MIGILPCQPGRFNVEPTFMDKNLCDRQSRPPVVSSAMPASFRSSEAVCDGYTGRYLLHPPCEILLTIDYKLTRITRHLFKYALSVGRHTIDISLDTYGDLCHIIQNRLKRCSSDTDYLWLCRIP
jgi:hypothetical protein